MPKQKKSAAVKSADKKSSKAPVASGKGGSKAAQTGKGWGPIRKKLLEMREDLSRAVRRKQEMDVVGINVGDEADQATSSIEKEMLFELNGNERTMLDQIEGALRKMEKNVYGLCESCQKPILKARLEAVPFARYCITCQSSSEASAAIG